MSRFLHVGHYEAVVPARAPAGPFSLRVWIDVLDLVPLLERLDRIFGDAGKPYCADLRQVPRAQGTLVGLVVDLLRTHPEKLRRACVGAAVAEGLRAEYGIRRRDAFPAYPPSIDQVELDPADLLPHLPALLRAG